MAFIGQRKYYENKKRFVNRKYKETTKIIIGHWKEDGIFQECNITFHTESIDYDLRLDKESAIKIRDYLNKLSL